MIYLISAISFSVFVSILLKIVKAKDFSTPQIIAFNYLSAGSCAYFLLSPHFNQLPFSDFLLHSPQLPFFLTLGILLPVVFLIMATSVAKVGIVKSDAAQRISLFLPVLSAFLLFNEQPTTNKILSLILAFIALFCLVLKKDNTTRFQFSEFPPLLGVFFGYGIIDILFKEVAKQGNAFPNTLFTTFVFAGIFMFVYLLIKRTQWQSKSFIAGLFLGLLNFGNIYFYIKAHQVFATDPTLVFASMNIGVICLGTIIGRFLFKEKVSLLNYCGILLGLLAILSLFYLGY